MEEEKREKTLPPRAVRVPCRALPIHLEKSIPERNSPSCNALPRETKFVYETPAHYVTGFRILDVYKTEVDFSEFKKFVFLEDPKLESKWGLLKQRMPYPEGRMTDLPGSRELHYKNYRLRYLSPESAMSWRKSIKEELKEVECDDEEQFVPECTC